MLVSYTKKLSLNEIRRRVESLSVESINVEAKENLTLQATIILKGGSIPSELLANCDAAILEITTKTDLFKSLNVNEMEFEDCIVQSSSKKNS